jgi:hypothetical protein
METEWKIEGIGWRRGTVLVLEKMMDYEARWVVGSQRKDVWRGLGRWEGINVEIFRGLVGWCEVCVVGTW